MTITLHENTDSSIFFFFFFFFFEEIIQLLRPMVFQRIAVFNPRGSYEGKIRSLDDSRVELISSSDFLSEDKFTKLSNTPRLSTISKIRIQFNDQNTEKLPFTKYQVGVNVYCTPRVTKDGTFSKEKFQEELSLLFETLYPLNSSAWISTRDDVYFYLPEFSTQQFLEALGVSDKDFSINTTEPFDIDYSYDGELSVLSLFGKTKEGLLIEKQENTKKEVGLFGIEEEMSLRDELAFSGVRVVMDSENVNSKNADSIHRTLLQISPRQRRLEGQLKSTIEDNGLHPMLHSSFSTSYPRDESLKECKLFYYLVLDKNVFVDPYQIPDLMTLLFNFGSKNLEAPEYSLKEWGNEILMEVKETENITLPLHTRYQLPQVRGKDRYIKKSINSPIIFYGCDVKPGTNLQGNPFDRKDKAGGNYERFFTEDSVFYHPETVHNTLLITFPTATAPPNYINFLVIMVLLVGIVIIIYPLFFRRPKVISSTKKKE